MSARICEWAGCEVTVTGRSKRCPEHQAEHRRAKQRARERARRAESAHARTCALAEAAEEERQAEIADVCSHLPRRKSLFVREYVANGGNATRAAIQAGYSRDTARQIGSRLLTFVDILAAVTKLQRLTDGPRGEVAASDALIVLHETVIGLREPSGPEVMHAAKVLLDRRDKRELLELRERLRRQPDEGQPAPRIIYTERPCETEEEMGRGRGEGACQCPGKRQAPLTRASLRGGLRAVRPGVPW